MGLMTSVPRTHVDAKRENAEQPDTPKALRDILTGGLTRPLSYADTLAAFTHRDEKDFSSERHRVRTYASDIGSCIRKLFYKRTGAPMDDGATGFDVGIGERGNAIEDRQTLMYRATHDPDAVLQNVRWTKTTSIEVDGESYDLAIICRADPTIIGDNLRVLRQLEIKSTDGYQFWTGRGSPAKEILDSGMTKVPLALADIETEDGKGVVKLMHALQLSMECRIARENGNEVEEAVVHYVKPGNLATYLEIVISRSDYDVLGELGERHVRQFMSYYLSGKLPPAWYGASWECRYCDWKAACAAENKKTKGERTLNPLFGGVNEALQRARQSYNMKDDDPDYLEARAELETAKENLRELDQGYIDMALKGVPKW